MNHGLLPHRSNASLFAKNSFATLQAEMNRLFDALGYDTEAVFDPFQNAPLSFQHQQLSPSATVTIDLKDAGNEFVLTAEVPGMDLNDILLATTPHYVSLSGEKKNDEDTHNDKHYKRERYFGFFRRVIHLPAEIDTAGVDAVYKDGVLTITLPKSQPALTNEKKINVKAG